MKLWKLSERKKPLEELRKELKNLKDNIFTIEQKEAINHMTGAMLVLAGPGSGKTTVITNRIKHLVDSGIEQENILVVTFTKMAANEMKQRYEKLINNDSMINFGTFHRIFFGIISKKYKITANNIVSDKFKFELLRQIILKYEKNIFDEEEVVSDFSNEIARVKRARLNPVEFKSEVISGGRFRDAFDEYRKTLLDEKFIDFEDMEIIAYNLLSRDKECLNFWKEKYKYILIDEFQDINQIQYDIVKLLLSEDENIFVVGDDDQAIYAFRGANPNIMLNFTNDYKNCKIIHLNQNFRSGKNIVEYAKKLISNNTDRYQKNIFTEKKDGLVKILEHKSEHDQAKAIIDEVKALLSNGIRIQDIAILIRLNYNGNILAYNFAKYGINYKMKGLIPDIYKHWAIVDILTYYRYAFNKNEITDLIKISNKPSRYIKRDAIISCGGNLKRLQYFYRSDIKMVGRISDLSEDLIMLAKAPNFEIAIKYILDGIDYRKFMYEFCEKNSIDIDEIEGIIQTLVDVCGNCKNYNEVEASIEEHKNIIQNSKNIKEGINIMTIHSAKGLEFKAVFIPNVNGDIIPYKKNDTNNSQEERRLMYVAMTRAIDYLYISYCNTIAGKNKEASIFIDEIS